MYDINNPLEAIVLIIMEYERIILIYKSNCLYKIIFFVATSNKEVRMKSPVVGYLVQNI